jgi:hypothetical protein
MTRFSMLSLSLILAAPAAAQDQTAPAGQPPSAEQNQSVQDFDLAREKIVDCEGQKYVFAWGAGAHPTKVTLCSEKDASRDEVIRMLDDAASKLATSALPEDRRTALVGQIRAKIAEIQSLSQATLPPPLRTEKVNPASAMATVAPLPPPLVASKSSSPPRVLFNRPRLTLTCMSPQLPSGGPCIALDRDTILTVKAGEALPSDVSLRFVRQDDQSAEVALGGMRKGQARRMSLPNDICKGALTGEVEIRIARQGQTVGREGPYSLHC